jgi:hypothetical protein
VLVRRLRRRGWRVAFGHFREFVAADQDERMLRTLHPEMRAAVAELLA